MGSFLKAIENAFAKLFGKAPSVLQKAQSAISFAAPVLKLILTETVDPEYATTVNNIVGEVQTDLSTASAVIAQSHNSADSSALEVVSTALTAVNGNLQSLLAAGHIKNTSTQAKITACVGEFAAVLSALAAPAA